MAENEQPSYVRIPAETYAQLRAQAEKLDALQNKIHTLEIQVAQYELLIEAQQTYAHPPQEPENFQPTASEPQTPQTPLSPFPNQSLQSTTYGVGSERPVPPATPPPIPNPVSPPPISSILEDATPEPQSTPVQPAASNPNFDLDLRKALARPQTSPSTPQIPPKPQSHLSTEEYVKSPIPYKEIFATALSYIYPENQGGPPSDLTLTPRRVNVIMNGIEMGLSRKGACALAGLSYKEIQKKKQEPYRTFLDLIDIAEARTEVRLLASWQSQTHNNWQAAQALLAKRFQQEWGDRHVIELTARQLHEMPDEELRAIIGDDLFHHLLPPPPASIIDAIIDDESPGQPSPNSTNSTNSTLQEKGVPQFDETITYD